MTRARFFISGKVQMVLFRDATRRRAKKLGLKGFVRNLSDGRVEVVTEGEQERIKKLIEWCRRGPLLAKVDNIEIVQESYADEFSKFEIKY